LDLMSMVGYPQRIDWRTGPGGGGKEIEPGKKVRFYACPPRGRGKKSPFGPSRKENNGYIVNSKEGGDEEKGKKNRRTQRKKERRHDYPLPTFP